MPGTGGERVLAAELAAGLLAVTVTSMRRNKGAPHPTQFVGLVGVFAILAGAAMLSPGVAHLAAGFGALVVLSLLITRSSDLLGAMSGTVRTAGKQGSGGLVPTGVQLDATHTSSTVLVTNGGTAT